MTVRGEAEEFVEAVIQGILVNFLPMEALVAVVVLPDLGGGVAVRLHDARDVRDVFGQAAVEAALGIPACLVLSGVPSGAAGLHTPAEA